MSDDASSPDERPARPYLLLERVTALVLLLVCVNLVGDGLARALDPRG